MSPAAAKRSRISGRDGAHVGDQQRAHQRRVGSEERVDARPGAAASARAATPGDRPAPVRWRRRRNARRASRPRPALRDAACVAGAHVARHEHVVAAMSAHAAGATNRRRASGAPAVTAPIADNGQHAAAREQRRHGERRGRPASSPGDVREHGPR